MWFQQEFDERLKNAPKCAGCGKLFEEGETVAVHGNYGVWHLACVDDAPDEPY